LELQNATLELGHQKLLKQIAQLAAENEELKKSAEERKKLRSGEAKLNGMQTEAKKFVNGYDADGFPIPLPRPKPLLTETANENVVPSPQVVSGTSLLFAETPPTNGSRRNTTPAVYLHNPTSPVVKMSPRCEFFRIGGRGSKSGSGTAEPTELLRQSLEEESDSDASSAKETLSATDSVAEKSRELLEDPEKIGTRGPAPPNLEVKVP
jgi:hypothetical protein